MRQRIVASRKITRAITGATMSALTIAGLATYGALKKKDEDADAPEMTDTEKGMKSVKDTWAADKIMGKAGPDLAYLYYLSKMNEGQGGAAAAYGSIKYVNNLLNNNPTYTTAGDMYGIEEALRQGHMNEKSQNKAAGKFGQLIGQFLNVPLYVPFHQIYDMIDGNPHKREFTKPESVIQGALMGGFIQDGINWLPDDIIENHQMQNWKYKPAYNPNAGQ